MRRTQPSPLVARGVTRTIGREGALITVTQSDDFEPFRKGDGVAVEILLDENAIFGQRCIYCRGVVSHVGRHSSEDELGVDFHTVMFRPVSRGLMDSPAEMRIT